MIPGSNFKKIAASKLSVYENHCFKPMEEKADISPVEYKLHPESRQIVADVLDGQVEHCRHLKQFLNNMI